MGIFGNICTYGFSFNNENPVMPLFRQTCMNRWSCGDAGFVFVHLGSRLRTEAVSLCSLLFPLCALNLTNVKNKYCSFLSCKFKSSYILQQCYFVECLDFDIALKVCKVVLRKVAGIHQFLSEISAWIISLSNIGKKLDVENTDFLLYI